MVVEVPDLPKYAAVEVELVGVPDRLAADLEGLQRTNRMGQVAGVNNSDGGGLAKMAWVPWPLPGQAPDAVRQALVVGAGSGGISRGDGVKGSLEIEVDAAIRSSVFCFGFLGLRLLVIGSATDLSEATDGLEASLNRLMTEAKLQRWHVAHLRVFLSARAGLPADRLYGMLEKSLGRLGGVQPDPALSLIPMSALETGVALVLQVTAHDPLKLDTERWVQNLH